MDEFQSSRNIKFCAYLSIKDVYPVEVKKLERGKAEYVYKISAKDFSMHQINYNQSEFIKYANALESIKDLAY